MIHSPAPVADHGNSAPDLSTVRAIEIAGPENWCGNLDLCTCCYRPHFRHSQFDAPYPKHAIHSQGSGAIRVRPNGVQTQGFPAGRKAPTLRPWVARIALTTSAGHSVRFRRYRLDARRSGGRPCRRAPRTGHQGSIGRPVHRRRELLLGRHLVLPVTTLPNLPRRYSQGEGLAAQSAIAAAPLGPGKAQVQLPAWKFRDKAYASSRRRSDGGRKPHAQWFWRGRSCRSRADRRLGREWALEISDQGMAD